MRDYWAENAVKLHAELIAAQIELSAADDVIAANAGDWFGAMGANEKASVIVAMRNLATFDVHAEKFSSTNSYSKVAGQPSYRFDVAAQVSTDIDPTQAYQQMGVTEAEFVDLKVKSLSGK